MSIFDQKHFHDEAAAYKFIEAKLWPDGRICPHCGVIGHSAPLKGKSTRIGVYKCYEGKCRKPFTVKIGTIFHDSRIELHLWLQAIALMAASKKGISASQLSRILGISVSSAWHMEHRLREVMKDDKGGPLGGGGGVVEMDETYHGKVSNPRTTRVFDGLPYKTGSRGPANKRAIVSIIERGGKVRSFHVQSANKATVAKIVIENIAKEATMYTDESRLYTGADAHVAVHDSVRHANNEYVRGEVTTNSIEGFFSIFKKGMNGVFQHCDEKHLHRYLAEFDFRHNTRAALGYNDRDRAALMLQGVIGKRLMYKRSSHAEEGHA